MNTYELEIRAACPVNDGETDLYQITVRSESLIPVESILGVFAEYKSKKIYQEDLTREAAAKLGAQVESVGLHSGVRVRCIAP